MSGSNSRYSSKSSIVGRVGGEAGVFSPGRTPSASASSETMVQAQADNGRCAKVLAFFRLCVLALGAFTFGTYEFLLAGLYNQTQETWGLDASEATQATLVFMVVATLSPLLSSLIPQHWNNRWLLASFQLVLAGVATLSALTPTFGGLLAARGVAALVHTPFTSLGMTQSVMLSKKPPESSMTHFLFGWVGASIVGIPGATLLGQHLQDNWQQAYWVITGMSGFAAVLIAATLPTVSPSKDQVSLADKWSVLKKLSVWGAFAVLTLGYGGVFGCHTFYDWIMTSLAGFDEADMPWLAFGWGLSIAAGNFIGGWLAKKSILLSIALGMPLLATVLTGFSFFATNQTAATILLPLNGLVGFSLVTPLLQYMASKATGTSLVSKENDAATEEVVEPSEQEQAIADARAGFGFALGLAAMGAGIVLNVATSEQVIPLTVLSYAAANLVGAAGSWAGSILFWALECRAIVAECRALAPRRRAKVSVNTDALLGGNGPQDGYGTTANSGPQTV